MSSFLILKFTFFLFHWQYATEDSNFNIITGANMVSGTKRIFSQYIATKSLCWELGPIFMASFSLYGHANSLPLFRAAIFGSIVISCFLQICITFPQENIVILQNIFTILQKIVFLFCNLSPGNLLAQVENTGTWSMDISTPPFS